MDVIDDLYHLETKWRDYLKERGHRVSEEACHFTVLTSRNHKKQRYRWLLMSGHRSKLTLNKSCQAEIHYHLRQAEAQRETIYLVVGFVVEPRRIIVLPARTALNASFVRSDKGGIAWDD